MGPIVTRLRPAVFGVASLTDVPGHDGLSLPMSFETEPFRTGDPGVWNATCTGTRRWTAYRGPGQPGDMETVTLTVGSEDTGTFDLRKPDGFSPAASMTNVPIAFDGSFLKTAAGQTLRGAFSGSVAGTYQHPGVFEFRSESYRPETFIW